MTDAKLIVALDVSSTLEAVEIASPLLPDVDFFKVGLNLFYSEGPPAIKALKDLGARVFLDLKLHDIPMQVRQAATVCAAYGIDMMTVHCLGGLEMLKAARAGAQEGARAAGGRRPLVMGVTILTSLDLEDMEFVGIRNPIQREVAILAGLAKDAGLDGVVASAEELRTVKGEFEEALKIVTPGIRPVWAGGKGDQKRVMTPGEAARGGATYLVVGRPITAAPDPREAALRVLDEIS